MRLYEKEFGCEFMLRLSDEQLQVLKIIALEEDRTRPAVLRRLLRQEAQRRGLIGPDGHLPKEQVE